MKNVMIWAKCLTNGLEERGYYLNKWYHLAIYLGDTHHGITTYPLNPNKEGGKKLEYSSLVPFFKDWGYMVQLDHLKKPDNTGQLDLFQENTISKYELSTKNI